MRPSPRPRAVVSATLPVTLNAFHRELIRQLSLTHDVHVVASEGPELEVLGQALGVQTHILTMTREISPRLDLQGLVGFTRLLRTLQPEIVVTATPKASLLGQVAALVSRVPQRLYYVGGLRLEGETGARRWLLRAMEVVTGRAATAVVVNSPSLRTEAERLGLFPDRRLHSTVPGSGHGVDTSSFAPAPRDPELARALGLGDRPVVGFAGRLTHDKGIDDLVTAARALAEAGTNAQLLVVGPQDEPDSRHYLRLLEDAGLPVATSGSVPPERMAAYYNLMDVHVLPSLREGFPNAVLEASACGVPTVTTTATGCVDSVLPGRTGLLVPVRDPGALASAMQHLLLDDEARTRMGSAAREWVSATFRPETVVRSVLRPVTSTSRPLRVLHLINDLGAGGAERLVVDLVDELRAGGTDARIVTLLPSAHTALGRECSIRSIPLLELQGRSRFDPRALLRLWRPARDVDVVHAHLFPAFYLAAILPVRVRVVTEHSPTNSREGHRLLARLERLVYARYNAVVAISDGVADALRRRLPATHRRLYRIHNGTRLEQFASTSHTGTADGPLRVVTVGTLDPRKNVGAAIRAVAAVPGTTLTVVGDGPERPVLEALAEALAAGRVRFTGRLDDVRDELSAAEAFLSTSRYEGFGLAALEAMASGLPVLAPDTPGLSEVVGDAGLLHPPGDAAALVADLERVRDSADLRQRLAREAVRRAASFDLRATAATLSRLYDDLCPWIGAR